MYLVHQFISSTLWNWYELVVNLWATTIFWRRGLQISPSPWRCCSKACASWCLWSSWSESRQQLDLKPNIPLESSDLPGLQTLRQKMVGVEWLECCGLPHCYSMPGRLRMAKLRRAPAAALRRYEPFPPKPCQSQSHTKLQLVFLFAAKFTPSPAQSNKQT